MSGITAEVTSNAHGFAMRRLIVRCAWVLSIVAVSCRSDGAPAVSVPPPTLAPVQVSVELSWTDSGSCCRVETVNAGEELSVVCFIDVFDADDRYVTTVLVPPKPAGHRRSSGFVAATGRDDQGEFDIPLDLDAVSYRTTCRPAAWHGGAPI